MKNENEIVKENPQGEVVLYQTEDGITKLDVRLEDGELDKEVVVRKNRTTTIKRQ